MKDTDQYQYGGPQIREQVQNLTCQARPEDTIKKANDDTSTPAATKPATTMNQAKQIVNIIYNDGLENHLRLIADELTIDEGRGRFSPRIEEAQTSEANSDEAALIVPESIDKKVYIGDREGLTVSPVPHQLEQTYASITNRSKTGPTVQPHNAVINLHHHDRRQKTRPYHINDTAPLIDQQHLTQYMRSTPSEKYEFGVTTLTINPSRTGSDGVIGVTNQKAYETRQLLNISPTPLVNKADQPFHAKDRHITKKYR